MKRVLIGSAVVFALFVLTIVILASGDCGGGEMSDGDADVVSPHENGDIPDAGNATPPQTTVGPGNLPLPDPTLAEEKRWERSRDLGPPPDGFATPYVQRERLFQNLFRRNLSDPIELCLDESRARGEIVDGELRFDLSASLRPRLRMNFHMRDVSLRPPARPPIDAGSSAPILTQLPADVRQCIADTIDATEMGLPAFAASMFLIDRAPDIRVDYAIREHSPAGPVEIEETPPVMPNDAGSPSPPTSDAGSAEAQDAFVNAD